MTDVLFNGYKENDLVMFRDIFDERNLDYETNWVQAGTELSVYFDISKTNSKPHEVIFEFDENGNFVGIALYEF